MLEWKQPRIDSPKRKMLEGKEKEDGKAPSSGMLNAASPVDPAQVYVLSGLELPGRRHCCFCGSLTMSVEMVLRWDGYLGSISDNHMLFRFQSQQLKWHLALERIHATISCSWLGRGP